MKYGLKVVEGQDPWLSALRLVQAQSQRKRLRLRGYGITRDEDATLMVYFAPRVVTPQRGREATLAIEPSGEVHLGLCDMAAPTSGVKFQELGQFPDALGSALVAIEAFFRGPQGDDA